MGYRVQGSGFRVWGRLAAFCDYNLRVKMGNILVTPFQGFPFSVGHVPRALPWAVMLGPFGPECTKSRRSFPSSTWGRAREFDLRMSAGVQLWSEREFGTSAIVNEQEAARSLLHGAFLPARPAREPQCRCRKR